MAKQTLRYAMVGGGQGSWIGEAHRKALALDNTARLVAGCFSSSRERSQAFGDALALPDLRVYGSPAELAEKEAALPADERPHFVVICTPNRHHLEQIELLAAKGFPIVCDKPLCETLAEGKQALAALGGGLLALTHCYAGYPMIKEARSLVKKGRLGTLRKVVVEYPQGWLVPEEAKDGKPAMSASTGVSSMVDVGTHAEHLARYVTGLEAKEVFADVSSFVTGGPRAPDDFNVLIRYEGGQRGVLIASQSSSGEQNCLRLRVYGSEGSLDWMQEDPNILTMRLRDQPVQTLHRGQPYLSPEARSCSRLPPGHPEGYLEAFANIYRSFAAAVQARDTGAEVPEVDFPTAADGIASLAFVEAVSKSSEAGTWVRV
ncbi:yfiI [Symbiodinium sp. KB8]|nr:yfiI [Symbiodinium sp. KB8]